MAPGPYFTVEWALSATKRYSDTDLYILDVLYARKLINSPDLDRALNTFRWGDRIHVEFANGRDDTYPTGEFTALLATEELRNTVITLRRYDTDGVHTFEARGNVTHAGHTGSGTFGVDFVTKDPDPLQTELPRHKISHEFLAADRPAAMRPGDHNGQPVNIPFGYSPKVPGRFILQNTDSDLFDFLLSYGPTEENCLRSLCLYFTMVAAGNAYLYHDMSGVADYVVPPGTIYLEYDINWYDSGARVAMDLRCSDGSALKDSGAADQNGLSCHPNTDLNARALQTWYHRRITLPAGWTGKTIQYYNLGCESDAGGTKYAWLSHIYLTDGAGTILKKIWDPGMGVPATTLYSDSGGGQSLSLDIRSRTDAGGETPTTVVYREDSVVDKIEWSVFNGSQYAPYNGYAFVRFYEEQRLPGGRLAGICADLRGLRMGGATSQRNFATVIKNALNDATWGVGLAVNAASFTAAATALADIYCDGAITDFVKAQDVISALLRSARDSAVDKNEAGEITIWADSYQASSAMTFDETDALGPRCSLHYYHKLDTSEATKKYKLSYGHNPWTGKCAYENERTVNASFGADRPVESRFIRNHESADRDTSYRRALEIEGVWRLGITVGLDGRSLTVGSRITVVYPSRNISGDFQVRRIRKKKNSFDLDCISYTSAIYTYTPGTMPADGNVYAPDYSKTAPAAPAGFGWITGTKATSEGTYQASDGRTVAYSLFKATLPAVNAQKLQFGYRKNGETTYTWIDGEISSGAVWNGRIDGLVPGLAYDYAVRAINTYDIPGALATLANQVAPGDTTAPATPTGLVAAPTADGMKLTWTLGAEADLAGYEIYCDGSNPPTTKVGDAGGKQNFFVIVGISSSLRYARIRAKDATGNISGYSAVVNATPATYAGGSTMGGNANNTDKVNGAQTDSGQIYKVYGDIRVMNGKDIYFYINDGSTLYGSLRADTSGYDGLRLVSNSSKNIFLEADKDLICLGQEAALLIAQTGDAHVDAYAGAVVLGAIGGLIKLQGQLRTDQYSASSASGNIVYKWPVYNLAGTLLGYLHLHDA